MTDCICGSVAYRPDSATTRRAALRCGRCHRVTGRCFCLTADIGAAIRSAKANRLTHVHWRDWRANGHGTDEDHEMVGDLAHHEAAIAEYDNILACLALAAHPEPVGLDVTDALAAALAGRTLLLAEACRNASQPFIENWRTIARVLLSDARLRAALATPSPTPAVEGFSARGGSETAQRPRDSPADPTLEYADLDGMLDAGWMVD